MIRHIVLVQAADGTSDQQLRDAAASLEALVGVVPGLRSLTAGVDGVGVEGHYALGLVAELDDAQALQSYLEHPAHVAAGEQIAEFSTDLALIDIPA